MANIVYPKDIGQKPVSEIKWIPRPIRVASIGGGRTSFIADEHVGALGRLGTLYRRVAGAPSRDEEKCREWALVNAPTSVRTYNNWKDMLAAEREHPEGADVVALFTETEFHAEMALAALGAGFHVISDKPPTTNLDEMIRIERAARAAGKEYLVTYNHNTYGAVLHGASLIAPTEARPSFVGTPYQAEVWFRQAWGLPDPKFKQAWRFKGERCCGADIGAHAERLASLWLKKLGFTPVKISAECQTIDPKRYPERKGDDLVNAVLVYQNGTGETVQVRLVASEMMYGHEDDLGIVLYGSSGSLRWTHRDADQLIAVNHEGERRLLEGRDFKTPATFHPAEHRTGFPDCWAAWYLGAFGKLAVALGWLGPDGLPAEFTIPISGVEEGVDSMGFIDGLYRSSGEMGEWVSPQELIRDARIAIIGR